MVEVSRSASSQDLAEREIRRVPVSEVLDFAGKDKVLRLLLADEDERVLNLVRQWPGSLQSYGMEISTGPVVPFRATEFINGNAEKLQSRAPLLWMQNVSAMRIEWPVAARNKAQHIADNEQSRYLLVKNRNYVLLRRFSAKEAARRLVAAPLLANTFDAPFIGLENHLNYVYRRKSDLSEKEAFGLAALLNSSLIDSYFRTSNGNTQISATELRALPLPPLALIEKLGERVIGAEADLETIDLLVNELFDL
ncbi:MAG: methyltransferase, partial [Acidobacteriota bacterium]